LRLYNFPLNIVGHEAGSQLFYQHRRCVVAYLLIKKFLRVVRQWRRWEYYVV